MKYDRTKTVVQNLLLLINAKAKRTVLASELSFSNPLAITPGAENGNNNTEITATFVKGAGDTGAINGSQTSIQYTRLTLAGSHPTANRTIEITDADTLATVKTKIASSQRLVADEFSLSAGTLPAAASTGAMPIDPIANSKLYAPGQLVLTLNNTSAAAAYAGNFYLNGDGLANDSTDIRNVQTGTALTVHGNARIRTNTRKYGSGALFLDGSGDRVSFPHTQVGDLLTGDFTIEMWVYQQAIPQYGTIFAQWSQQSPQSTYGGILFYLAGGVPEFYHRAVSVAGPVVAGVSAVPLQKWTHLAVTREGSVFRLFVNGIKVSEATSAATAAPNTIVPMSIGNYYNTGGALGAVSDFNGVLDEIGIHKGVARYTANFTPTPLSGAANPLGYQGHYLIRADGKPDGSTLIENEVTGTAHVVYGNARIRTAQQKYGTGALYFDGNGDWIEFPSPYEFANLYTGDFTIEGWFHPEVQAGNKPLISQMWQLGGRLGFTLSVLEGIPKFLFGPVSEADYCMTSSTVMPINTWSHLAVTRTGNVFRMFLNGVQVATVTSAGVSTSANYQGIGLVLGMFYNGSGGFPGTSVVPYQGYMDNVAIHQGVSRYTGPFTPADII